MILSREGCHCNPLMLLSHPRRVTVSVPALIYSGCRKWREWAMCSSRHPINAFTMLLQCQPGDDISVISHHGVVMFSLCLSFSISRSFPLVITALAPHPLLLFLCFVLSCPSFLLLLFLICPSPIPIFSSLFRSMLRHKIDCNYCVAVSRMD